MLQVIPHEDSCDCCSEEFMSDVLSICWLERDLFFQLCEACCDKAVLDMCMCFEESDKHALVAGITICRVNPAGHACKICIDKAFSSAKQKEMHKARLEKNAVFSEKRDAEQLQKDFMFVKKWVKEHGMAFNVYLTKIKE